MKFDIILPFWKAFLIFRFELLVLCSCAFPQNETTIARVNSTQLYYIQKAFCTHLVPGTTSQFSRPFHIISWKTHKYMNLCDFTEFLYRPFEIIWGESSSRLKFIWLLFCASLAKNLGNWRCLTFFILLWRKSDVCMFTLLIWRSKIYNSLNHLVY